MKANIPGSIRIEISGTTPEILQIETGHETQIDIAKIDKMVFWRGGVSLIVVGSITKIFQGTDQQWRVVRELAEALEERGISVVSE